MILVEWADALVIIAANFDLPLFDMAMEKYTQVCDLVQLSFNDRNRSKKESNNEQKR